MSAARASDGAGDAARHADEVLARALADRRYVVRFASGSSFYWSLTLRRARDGGVLVREVKADMHDPMGGHVEEVQERLVDDAEARALVLENARTDRPALAPSHHVQLRALRGDRAADVAAAQSVLDAVPAYFTLATGAPARADEAARLFAELPVGKESADKRVWAAWAAPLIGEAPGDGTRVDVEQLVGLVDALRGWPTPERAMIGLLAVPERLHRRGLATHVLAAVERGAHKELGARRLRVAILEENAAAQAFWRERGFTPTGERKPWVEGSVSSTVDVLEKELAPRP